ncbi:hypothetical protein GCM10011490_07780 [Pseudoclavibacter endophyticus]|uniref:Polyketide cyclase n=1 Tax=Pseudoclavibacter endophyticus TaxID=1778590 RepID=A0A6H9WLN7_9MICO|nr:SRPBCC family protein [Pseudoclavibacter endophyticus]KAB1649746.1 polyketide cyclase [Pseudoclavibacter endophyticus]GGA60074.1 hypothetical protein GCM10011490_07780 [Pseudoclavibacter endophyticus]
MTTSSSSPASADSTPDSARATPGSADEAARVVAATRDIVAPPHVIFALIADPAQQPRWDGNDNLDWADSGQRVREVGEVFVMRLTREGMIRENHVVEFEEGRRIAWQPSEPGAARPGHLWRWELEPHRDGTRVTHTYDWSRLNDPAREVRARATTAEHLEASLERLAELAEAADSTAGP